MTMLFASIPEMLSFCKHVYEEDTEDIDTLTMDACYEVIDGIIEILRDNPDITIPS